MNRKDKIFISITILTSIALFAFVFWLGFPGYFQEADIYNYISVTTNHWHPVLIARFLETLYFLFGRHTFYLFALNLFCFYAGFAFFITAFYIRTRNVLAYALFLITLIGNIFFQNFTQYNSFTFPMLMWLGCSMIFFQILVPVKNRYLRMAMKMLTGIVLIFALLWRHNAIISVYPLCILFIYFYLKQKRITSKANYALRFLALLMVSACVLVFGVKAYPYLLAESMSKNMADHVFLHQIAGMVVPANDHSFIPQTWYVNGKNFQNVKERYAKYPQNADRFNDEWKLSNSERPFKNEELSGLEMVWLKGILKYPANYVKHVSGFCKTMWFQYPGWIFNSNEIQKPPSDPWQVVIASNFSENERKITFSLTQKRIYNFFIRHKIVINHIAGVAIGFLILSVTGLIWIFLPSFRSDLLLFTLSTSMSTCCTAMVVCIFSPITDSRYMSPVLPLSLIGLIGFATFLYLAIFSRHGGNE